MTRLAILALLTVMTGTQCVAEETLWAPTDFDGAWVEVLDAAENGCWTNIGEVKAYATDQLDLAGFRVIERPKGPVGGLAPSIGKNIILVIQVKGQRWPDGTCIGSLMVHFLGRVIIVPSQRRWVTNTIGYPAATAIWDKDNFNTIVLDESKNYIASWVDLGKIKATDN
ncbi:hypothetical protein BMI86_13880 [Thioclava sp. DLFJ5-1]|uniref:hypothetical protein n=1 Tax=Thioclava sp. DLFJ5-1 TaxID=1915314 RepID=UPI0009960E3C|nr:hypothetical protein [Thioclava sp. DLFJ5-1]OOY19712.1 hypothetical protein BMI86_13880 [Thioclava sp. DLFJ5-1]